jgi:hypothetical protein
MSALLTPVEKSFVERRRSRRFRLSAPAVFCWAGSDGILHEHAGATRDISKAGALVISDLVPPSSCPVEVDVYLPRETAGRGLQLHGEGRVVRVEAEGTSGSGFATEATFQTELPNNLTMFLGPESS